MRAALTFFATRRKVSGRNGKRSASPGCPEGGPKTTITEPRKKKYDNSTRKKINRPLASAARFPSHSAGTRLLCAFTKSASGGPCPGRRLSGEQHSGRNSVP